VTGRSGLFDLTLETRTVALPVGARIDPVALATSAPESGGFLLSSPTRVLAGVGAAARVELPNGMADTDRLNEAVRWLASLPATSGGVGPVLFTALPFARCAPATLYLPDLLLEEHNGTTWVTVAQRPGASRQLPADPDLLYAALAERFVAPAGDFDTRALGAQEPKQRLIPEESVFLDTVRAALRAIAEGRIEKVVLSRSIDTVFDVPVDPTAVLHRLSVLETSSSIFAVMKDGHAFLGASPELLVARDGLLVRSHPLAGTAALPGDEEGNDAAIRRLVASPKEQAEHAAVVEAVSRTLSAWCTAMETPRPPQVVRLRNVAHLGTQIRGTLAHLDAQHSGILEEHPSALRLAAELHPTPAVAGTPRDVALELLDQLETDDRGPYAGPVGWVAGNGDGEFVVGIRSVELSGTLARVRAGAGIVAGSEPDQELAETTAKLHTALRAIH
jgi:isochorismate synthase